MRELTSSRLAVAGAVLGGTAFAAAGALQATGLHWKENAVQTPLQHLTMVLIAIAFVAVVPTWAALGRLASGWGRNGWVAIAVGQIVVAGASTVSNIRGVDASWFPATAIAANLVWVIGTIALAIALYRGRRVPRLVAVGVVVAYLGSIPFGSQGGGIVTGCFWLAVGYLLSLGALERSALQPATA